MTPIDVSIPPAIAVLTGARDRFHLAIALEKFGYLDRLVTDFYYPGDKRLFTDTLGRSPLGPKLLLRYDPRLPSGRVNVPTLAAMFSLLRSVGLGRSDLAGTVDRLVSTAARKLAAQQGLPIFANSYNAYDSFIPGEDRPDRRFLFQVHPHPSSTRRILKEEMERTPHGRSSLAREAELARDDAGYERLCKEPHYANGWVTASTFTARTLSEHGVPLEKIHVVPYGVNSDRFPNRIDPPAHNSKFTVLFVGNIIQRKGVSDLLDAILELKSKEIRVVLVGRSVDRKLLHHYTKLDVEVHLNADHDTLLAQLHSADVFVFPSLVEGFAHSILEAMSSGLPIIASDHTSAPDLIEQATHGFIVPIRSVETIAERLEWSLTNRHSLFEMGQECATRARTFTWERFHAGVARAYYDMYTDSTVS